MYGGRQDARKPFRTLVSERELTGDERGQRALDARRRAPQGLLRRHGRLFSWTLLTF
jgi:hypothetical protein